MVLEMYFEQTRKENTMNNNQLTLPIYIIYIYLS